MTLVRLLVYLASAVAITWPLALSPGTLAVGDVRTDVWNSIWSYWFVAEGLAGGHYPVATTLLDHPGGGRLLVADPLNTALAAPLTWWKGPSFAYGVMLILHLALAGFFADALGRRLGGRGWIAGLAYPWSAIVLSHLQNGSSEATGVAWLPLAGLACVWASESGSARRVGLAALALAACAVGGGWYAGIDAFILAAAMALFVPGGRRLWPALVLGALMCAPVAMMHRELSAGAGGLIDIKTAEAMSRLRRTIGAADVRSAWLPGEVRIPDFSRFEQNASDFVHTTYLGYALLVLALWKGRSRALWLATIIAFVLAHGPVLVRDGGPVAFMGRALPLPYAIIEALPGFGSLSLLYRLATLVPLGLGLLADRAHPSLGVLVVAETLLLSPARALPHHVPTSVAAPVAALAAEPEGAVISLPSSFARTRLFEQTAHQHPLTASINAGLNPAALSALAALRKVEESELTPEQAANIARDHGVRYVIIHPDQPMEATFAPAVRVLKARYRTLSDTPEARVFAIY